MPYTLRHNFPVRGEKQYVEVMHTINSVLALDANPKAQLRLRCIELLETHSFKAVAVAFPGISRASVYRWRRKYLTSRKTLSGLLAQSTKPQKVRQMVVPIQVLGFLKQLREEYPHLSKYKLKPFLDVWCAEQNLPKYSVSWIGKVLSRHELFFNTRKRVKRQRRRPRSGYRVYRAPNTSHLKIGYLQLDGVKVCWNGQTCLFLSALEVKTRTAWAKRVNHLSSLETKVFLEEILLELPYSIHTIHTDNGSEFKALFDKAVEELKITHLWSPPRTPKVHAHIERFNKTL